MLVYKIEIKIILLNPITVVLYIAYLVILKIIRVINFHLMQKHFLTILIVLLNLKLKIYIYIKLKTVI